MIGSPSRRTVIPHETWRATRAASPAISARKPPGSRPPPRPAICPHDKDMFGDKRKRRTLTVRNEEPAAFPTVRADHESNQPGVAGTPHDPLFPASAAGTNDRAREQAGAATRPLPLTRL